MLEGCLTKGMEILDSEFGFYPRETSFCVLDGSDFSLLKSRRNLPITSQGVLLVRTLEAVVEDRCFEDLLPNAFHEYLGHGSFYEHNKKGKVLRGYELRLDELENEFVQEKLNHGEPFKLRFSEDPSSRNRDDGKLIVNININEPSAKEYLSLRELLSAESKSLEPLDEGFAIWLEDFLLSSLGKRELFERRNLPFMFAYNRLKEYEFQTGPLTLLTKIGFPKRFDDDKKVRIVKENVKDFANVECLISFGSGNEYSDINMLVVKKDGLVHHIRDNNVDFFQINYSDLRDKLVLISDLSDVNILRSGKLIYGSLQSFESLKSLTNSLGPKAVDYHFEESKNLFGYAEHYYKEAVGKNDPFLFSISLIDLSYALSYNLAARLYSEGHTSPFTYKELLGFDDGSVSEVRSAAKNNPTDAQTRNLLDKYRGCVDAREVVSRDVSVAY